MDAGDWSMPCSTALLTVAAFGSSTLKSSRISMVSGTTVEYLDGHMGRDPTPSYKHLDTTIKVSIKRMIQSYRSRASSSVAADALLGGTYCVALHTIAPRWVRPFDTAERMPWCRKPLQRTPRRDWSPRDVWW